MVQVKKLFKCQKAIRIKKERLKDDNFDVNFVANKKDMLYAMQQLSSVGFMLYMYCISNQQNYTFGLSKQDVLLSTGMADRSYTSAVKSLIDNGFLVYTGDQATDGVETAPLYDFYSRPNRMQNLLNE